MMGLTKAVKPVSIPRKPARQGWFFHIWSKRLRLNAQDRNDLIAILGNSPLTKNEKGRMIATSLSSVYGCYGKFKHRESTYPLPTTSIAVMVKLLTTTPDIIAVNNDSKPVNSQPVRASLFA